MTPTLSDGIPAPAATGSLPGTDDAVDRRKTPRVPGPFDGLRGTLETSVQIFDLSEGGCFVNAMHEQKSGTTITLEIDLPNEGRITVKGETLYTRSGFGFAVRFVDVSPGTRTRITRALDSVLAESEGLG